MSGAEAWRERVEDVLWVELGRDSRMSSSRTGVLGPGPPARPGPEVIEAFASLGLLPEPDADRWRTRFTRDEPWQPEVARERLHAHLGELVRETGTDGEASPRRSAALDVLLRLGLLDHDDLAWWSSLGCSAGASPAGPAPPPCRLARRLRTIPGPAERRRGVRIIALDLFDDGVCVHLQLARGGRDEHGSLPPLADERLPGVPIAWSQAPATLGDDVGTRYVPTSGGGAATGGAVDGPFTRARSWVFGGAVPDEASLLIVRNDEDVFEVPL